MTTGIGSVALSPTQKIRTLQEEKRQVHLRDAEIYQRTAEKLQELARSTFRIAEIFSLCFKTVAFVSCVSTVTLCILETILLPFCPLILTVMTVFMYSMHSHSLQGLKESAQNALAAAKRYESEREACLQQAAHV